MILAREVDVIVNKQNPEAFVVVTLATAAPLAVWAAETCWTGPLAPSHEIIAAAVGGLWLGALAGWPRKRKHRTRLDHLINAIAESVLDVQTHPHHKRRDGLPRENPREHPPDV